MCRRGNDENNDNVKITVINDYRREKKLKLIWKKDKKITMNRKWKGRGRNRLDITEGRLSD